MPNRQELIKNYEDVGATEEALQDFKKLSPDKMEIELNEQKKQYDDYMLTKEKYQSLSKKEYNRLLREYDLEDDSEDRSGWYSVYMSVEGQKFRTKMQDSITNYVPTDQIEMDVSEARYRLEKLKLSPDTKDLSNFEHQNLIINLENIIKSAFGIAAKALIMTDNDLETILSLDNFTIDKNCQAFLDAQKPALKVSYSERMKDILALRSANIESQKREKEKLRKVNSKYESLATAPTKIIRRSDGRIEVNKDYVDWCDGIKAFQNDLMFLSKSYTDRKVEVPFQEIVDNINNKISQHKL